MVYLINKQGKNTKGLINFNSNEAMFLEKNSLRFYIEMKLIH